MTTPKGMLVDSADTSRAGTDGFDIAAALATRYGVDVDLLLDELSGTSTLARIGRDLLGLQGLERPPAKRGRKAQSDRNWKMFCEVSASVNAGQSLDEAVTDYLRRNGRDDPEGSHHDATTRQFRRLKQKNWQPVSELAALFVGPPADIISR